MFNFVLGYIIGSSSKSKSDGDVAIIGILFSIMFIGTSLVIHNYFGDFFIDFFNITASASVNPASHMDNIVVPQFGVEVVSVMYSVFATITLYALIYFSILLLRKRYAKK